MLPPEESHASGDSAPPEGDPGAAASDVLHRDLVSRLTAAVYAARSGAVGEWLYVSPQIETILGFTPDEFVRDPGLWARRIHPDDRVRVLEGEARIVLDRRRRDYDEYRMITKQGRVVWVLDDVTLLTDPVHGELQHGLLYDITRRKHTEMLLSEHADIVERVARGDDLVETLQALAASTQSITGASWCTIVVNQHDPQQDGLAVSAFGVVDPRAHPPTARVLPFHDAAGEPLGHIVIDAAAATPGTGEDEDGLTWATRLASIAVGRALQDERTETSLSLLEATLESTADGILVVDASGRIAGHNQKFREMWEIPDEVMASGEDEQLLAHVLGQLSDPAGFVAEVARLYRSPELSSHDVIEFTDGRVFERYSQPQQVDGHSVGRVWSFRDMTSHRRLERALRQQAYSDTLTGLPNRHLFMERLTAALADPDTEGSVGLLLLDVDDFKTVNDSLGHTAGDSLLARLAERLLTCVRTTDTAARLGGDEFVLLLEHLPNPDQAVALAERLLATLAEPVEVDGRMMTARASIGIALATPGTEPGDLVRNADLAMYTAKRDGGAGYRLYECEMHAEAMVRLDLKADLGRALEREELVLSYQPMVGLGALEITGFEALLRWQHPERGLVPPVEFVALAEETGLIDRIGRWVLATACAEAARWHDLYGPLAAPSVNVNLSARQLSNPMLVDEVREALAATGLPPAKLCLEITESALVQPAVDVKGVLGRIKSLGVRLALDDFGTGYSSLGRLGQYPLDVVKIDQSFIDRLDERRSAALVEAILRLAEAFDLDVVAEGIETRQQLSTLRSLGCPKGQGFLISRGVPGETARDMLLAPIAVMV